MVLGCCGRLFLVNRQSSLPLGSGTEEGRNALCRYSSRHSPSLLKNAQPSQRNDTCFPFTHSARDQRHLPLLARPIAIPTTKRVVPMAVPTPGLWSATAMAAPTPTPSTLARPRLVRKSLDLFAGVRSSIRHLLFC